MTLRFAKAALSALAIATFAASSIEPASAMTLSAPSLAPLFAADQIDQVHWWRHHHCWRGRFGHLHCRYWR